MSPYIEPGSAEKSGELTSPPSLSSLARTTLPPGRRPLLRLHPPPPLPPPLPLLPSTNELLPELDPTLPSNPLLLALVSPPKHRCPPSKRKRPTTPTRTSSTEELHLTMLLLSSRRCSLFLVVTEVRSRVWVRSGTEGRLGGTPTEEDGRRELRRGSKSRTPTLESCPRG